MDTFDYDNELSELRGNLWTFLIIAIRRCGLVMLQHLWLNTCAVFIICFVHLQRRESSYCTLPLIVRFCNLCVHFVPTRGIVIFGRGLRQCIFTKSQQTNPTNELCSIFKTPNNCRFDEWYPNHSRQIRLMNCARSSKHQITAALRTDTSLLR